MAGALVVFSVGIPVVGIRIFEEYQT